MESFRGTFAVLLCCTLCAPAPFGFAQSAPASPAQPDQAANKPSHRAAYQSGQLQGDERILHALNRFTFGPRPGDLEAVRAMGPVSYTHLSPFPSPRASRNQWRYPNRRSRRSIRSGLAPGPHLRYTLLLRARLPLQESDRSLFTVSNEFSHPTPMSTIQSIAGENEQHPDVCLLYTSRCV